MNNNYIESKVMPYLTQKTAQLLEDSEKDLNTIKCEDSEALCQRVIDPRDFQNPRQLVGIQLFTRLYVEAVVQQVLFVQREACVINGADGDFERTVFKIILCTRELLLDFFNSQ